MQRRSLLTQLAAGAASLALPALAQTDRRIVLGQSAPLTGPAAQLGIQFQQGAKLAFRHRQRPRRHQWPQRRVAHAG